MGYTDGDQPRVTKLPPDSTFAPADIAARMAAEKLHPYRWSNAPGDTYAPHSHTYDKVIYVVSGSITFGLPDLRRNLRLDPGDRLDLPAGIVHDAQVGPEGVVCLEGHR